MKTILPLLAAIICIIVLISGKIHWDEKTKVSSSISAQATETKSAKEQPKESKSNDTAIDDALFKNWPEGARDTFKQAIAEGKTYRIALVGSQQEMGDDTNGWASQLKNALATTYGNDHVEISIFAYDSTSLAFINQQKYAEIVDFNADLVLFEPFILTDNGKIAVENNHENILTTINAIKQQNEHAVVILQPSNPIYHASIYPEQVSQLQDFASENDIPYIDHWSAWPDSQTEAIKEYLDEDSNPNEKGQQVWFEYLKKYFIAE